MKAHSFTTLKLRRQTSLVGKMKLIEVQSTIKKCLDDEASLLSKKTYTPRDVQRMVRSSSRLDALSWEESHWTSRRKGYSKRYTRLAQISITSRSRCVWPCRKIQSWGRESAQPDNDNGSKRPCCTITSVRIEAVHVKMRLSSLVIFALDIP